MTAHIEMPASAFKAIVSILQPLTTEVKITAKPEGLSIKAVDAAHVSMVALEIDGMGLPVYEVTDEEVFGLDLTKTKSILSLAGGDENVSLEIGDRLTFKIGNIKRTMAILDTATMTDPKMPELTLSGSATVTSAHLQRAVKAVSGIGADAVTMAIREDRFMFSATADTQDASMDIEKGEECTIEYEKDIQSMYPMDYVSSMIPAIPSDYKVKVSLDIDYPTVMEFTNGNIKGKYLIAPRIEQQE